MLERSLLARSTGCVDHRASSGERSAVRRHERPLSDCPYLPNSGKEQLQWKTYRAAAGKKLLLASGTLCTTPNELDELHLYLAFRGCAPAKPSTSKHKHAMHHRVLKDYMLKPASTHICKSPLSELPARAQTCCGAAFYFWLLQIL